MVVIKAHCTELGGLPGTTIYSFLLLFDYRFRRTDWNLCVVDNAGGELLQLLLPTHLETTLFSQRCCPTQENATGTGERDEGTPGLETNP